MRAETTPEYQLEALSEGAEVTGFKETAASRFESSGLLRHFRHLEGPWAMPHDHTFYVVCTCSTLYWLVDTEKIRAASRPRVNRSLVDAEIDEITPDGYWGPSRPEIRELLPGARLQAHEQRQRDPAPE